MSALKLRTDGVAWIDLSGETILVDLRSGMYLSANRSAGTLWELLVAGTTHSALTEALMEAFGISAEQAKADVDRFLDDCRENDLLEKDEG
jgi:hypothetical protein